MVGSASHTTQALYVLMYCDASAAGKNGALATGPMTTFPLAFIRVAWRVLMAGLCCALY